MFITIRRITLTLILFFNIFGIYAQESDKIVRALKIENKLLIDGILSESEWNRATLIDEFIVKDPLEGAIPKEQTEVKLLYNQKNFYIGIRVFKDPDSIRAYVSRRDNMGNSERIVISLDTYNDNNTSYSFAITASGVRADYYHSTDNEYDRDYNYNPVWQGKSMIDSLGWSAEIEIPFHQLRFNDENIQVWGLNMNHYTPTIKEDKYWVLIKKMRKGGRQDLVIFLA